VLEAIRISPGRVRHLEGDLVVDQQLIQIEGFPDERPDRIQRLGGTRDEVLVANPQVAVRRPAPNHVGRGVRDIEVRGAGEPAPPLHEHAPAHALLPALAAPRQRDGSRITNEVQEVHVETRP
jgi:hypothetical protein